MTDTLSESQCSSRRAIWTDRIGSMLFFGGICLLMLWFFASAPNSTLSMPGFWYRNARLWPFLGIVVSVSGYLMLQREPPLPDSWQPSLPGERFQRVVIYTKPDCHLCDVAKDSLHRFSLWLPSIEEIDIESDDELFERFRETIPVIEIDGRERFRGSVNTILLQRLIEATAPNKRLSGKK